MDGGQTEAQRGHKPRKDPGKSKGERAVSKKSGARPEAVKCEWMSMKDGRGSQGILWKVQTQRDDYRCRDKGRGNREWSLLSVVVLSTCLCSVPPAPQGFLWRPGQLCLSIDSFRIYSHGNLKHSLFRKTNLFPVLRSKKSSTVVGGLWEGYGSDQGGDSEKARKQGRVDRSIP